jgi:hypothetical protein
MVWRVVHVDARAVLLMLAMVAPMLTVGSAWPPVADLAQVAAVGRCASTPAAVVFGGSR